MTREGFFICAIGIALVVVLAAIPVSLIRHGMTRGAKYGLVAWLLSTVFIAISPRGPSEGRVLTLSLLPYGAAFFFYLYRRPAATSQDREDGPIHQEMPRRNDGEQS